MCVEIVDEQEVERPTGALGVLVDVEVAVLRELPDRLGFVREEGGRCAEQALVRSLRHLEVAYAVPREELEGHGWL